jgi:repressor LexA
MFDFAKPTKKLSFKQQRIIDFLRSFALRRNYPPTVRDIVKGCQISSTSVVDYNLNILEREGYIRRHPGISRGIELISTKDTTNHTVKIPIVGLIAAGEPIPVPSPDTWDTVASSDTLEITEELTRGKDMLYALKVKGYSMIDALINDGDIVLMQNVNTVENGETAAVWLKAEKEVTLKKVFRESAKGGRIRLQPANSQMKPIYADPDNVEIQGRVIGVIRQLD